MIQVTEGMFVTDGAKLHGRVIGVKRRNGRIVSVEINWNGGGGCTAMNTTDATYIRMSEFTYGWKRTRNR